jgi:hypothetical protein
MLVIGFSLTTVNSTAAGSASCAIAPDTITRLSANAKIFFIIKVSF